MPFYAKYQNPNPMIDSIQKTWDNAVENGNTNKDGLELMMYMSKELGKETSDNMSYFKIANFIYYLLFINEKTKEADGIIYTSVPSQGQGFNIVLKPESVDKKLQFDTASQMFLYKNGEKAYSKIINRSIDKDSEGKLKFEPMQENDNEKLKEYEGLSFVN